MVVVVVGGGGGGKGREIAVKLPVIYFGTTLALVRGSWPYSICGGCCCCGGGDGGGGRGDGGGGVGVGGGGEGRGIAVKRPVIYIGTTLVL